MALLAFNMKSWAHISLGKHTYSTSEGSHWAITKWMLSLPGGLPREPGSRDQEPMLFLSERGSKDPHTGKWLPNKLTNKRSNKPQTPSYWIWILSLILTCFGLSIYLDTVCVINLDNKYSKVRASYTCLLSSGIKHSFDISIFHINFLISK